MTQEIVVQSADSGAGASLDMAQGDTAKAPGGRLGWRSRCREMQGVSRRKKADKQGAAGDQPRERVSYSDEIANNPEFERYYQDQRICPPEEWEAFMAACRRSIPISFRINTSAHLWRHTIRRLAALSRTHDDLCLTVGLSYTPEVPDLDPGTSLCYQLKPDKSSLRKNDKVTEFRRCLIDEDNRGAVMRQELVSMLPVIYLDPQPHENIVDLCAAPGMKFLQILDTVNTALQYRDRQPPCSNRGVIIGNDVCQHRVSTLSHHMKTVSCPSAAVTNFDGGWTQQTIHTFAASRFPYLHGASGEKLLFDRVLADVPCSCDGTTRKAPELWSTWKATSGLHMHRLQLSIVKRALQLLKPGGVMVYSTCSLNPLENEAIASYVASEGRREHGVELQPLQPLPNFKVSPGLTEWLVPNPDGGYFKSYDEVPAPLRPRVYASMFRSPEWGEEQARCVMRVLPHQNDTGGFFLFKVRKAHSAMPANHGERPQEIRPINVVMPQPRPSVALKRGAKLLHDYVRHCDVFPDMFDTICRFYGIDGDKRTAFGRVLVTKRYCQKNCFLVGAVDSAALFQKRKSQKAQQREGASSTRAESPVASGELQDVQEANAGQPEALDAVKDEHEETKSEAGSESVDNAEDAAQAATNTDNKCWEPCRYAQLGTRVLAKMTSKATLDSPCEMRISQEGCLAVLEFISRRVAFANAAFCADFKESMPVQELLKHEQLGNIQGLDSCRQSGKLESGGCVVIIVPAWGRARIPASGVSVTLADGVVVNRHKTPDAETAATDDRQTAASVSDIMDVIPLSCIISDMGTLLAYASPQVLKLLQSVASETNENN
ncbi:proliferating-cell nucleolar protein, putative [Babesia bigemina]|uniref:Proliferating-cell nucleolar protein, putative n=1 Tax=Babesia bigemina TaxID=5866 RepID=A0A061DET8_BABBI|nr:proliferating-cell nucleolar protein, putative [Babesia bigemina]CDR97855.1 proliferating-cell nucleolar protein, putative [Babesia bigemina]|eukprot:XP_012770041.1 proliferating-cell nucleolar protein, putative [Babesia bigemina]